MVTREKRYGASLGGAIDSPCPFFINYGRYLTDSNASFTHSMSKAALRHDTLGSYIAQGKQVITRLGRRTLLQISASFPGINLLQDHVVLRCSRKAVEDHRSTSSLQCADKERQC